MADVKKIVLAYSGGLDTSVILKWLSEEYQCPIVAYAADVGQEEDWDAVRAKGLATGAEKVIISDLKKEFVEDYIFLPFAPMPSMRARIFSAPRWRGRSLPKNRCVLPMPRVRMQSVMVPPARAMIRCVLNWLIWGLIPV